MGNGSLQLLRATLTSRSPAERRDLQTPTSRRVVKVVRALVCGVNSRLASATDDTVTSRFPIWICSARTAGVGVKMMRLGSLAPLVISCACQATDHPRSNSASLQQLPSGITAHSTPTSSSVPVAPSVSAKLPPSFYATAPKPLQYVHLQPEAGKPSPPAFEVGAGPTGATSNASSHWLRIDERGFVWRCASEAQAAEGRRVGRVPIGELARMRRLARDVARHPARGGEAGCLDCATTSYLAFGIEPGNEPSVLAKHGRTNAEPTSDDCREVVAWLESVNGRALRLPRPTPLGFSLPIVADLRDVQPVSPAPPNARVVFELRHGTEGVGVGLQVDAAGGVHRFKDYLDQRSVVRVAQVSASTITRVLGTLSVGAWQAEAEHRRDCARLVWFETAGAAAKPLASNCSDAGHAAGADAAIAWVQALDEQAANVPNWPLD